ncbi:hypothetical protein CYMTET_52001, partial [Cymbomonas tetramitiformis]
SELDKLWIPVPNHQSSEMLEDHSEHVYVWEAINTVLDREETLEDVAACLDNLSRAERQQVLMALLRARSLYSHMHAAMLEISKSLDLRESLSNLVKVVWDLLGAEHVTLLADPAKNGLLQAALHMDPDVDPVMDAEVHDEANMYDGLIGECFKSGEVMMIGCVEADSRFDPEVDEHIKGPVAYIPIRSNGSNTQQQDRTAEADKVFMTESMAEDQTDCNPVIAVLQVVFGQHPTKIKNFGALDPMFLQSLGALAHQHLRQAVLHVTRSTRLRQISALIEHIVKIVLQRIKGIMGVARSSLFIVEPKKGDIWSLSSDGMQPIRLPQGVGLVGACANSGQVINIYDAYSDERFNRAVDIATGFKTKNILCVPVHNQKHEVVAVIQLINKVHLQGFTKMDEEISKTFASSIAPLLPPFLLPLLPPFL